MLYAIAMGQIEIDIVIQIVYIVMKNCVVYAGALKSEQNCVVGCFLSL